MLATIAQFEQIWVPEREATLKILNALTDGSLQQAASPDDRTLGRMAWHLATTLPEMARQMGLHLEGPPEEAPTPSTVTEIRKGYEVASQSLLNQVKNSWTDTTLQMEDNMYGEQWKRGFSLMVIVTHQIHHRGQMTVLMRMAGLKVPGVYGPAREEWAQIGMAVPAV